jgi:hypothetical protein
MTFPRLVCLSGSLAVAASAFSAPTSFPANAKGLHLETVVGSFKIKRGSEDLNQGVCDINFTGTVLVSNLQGVATPGAGVKLEYDRPDMQRKVFHGTGSLHIAGKFGSISFFGRDMNALYNGSGVVQLYGEFDKNLNTGYYWYGDDPTTKRDWGSFGATILPVRWKPKNDGLINKHIHIKDVGKKG